MNSAGGVRKDGTGANRMTGVVSRDSAQLQPIASIGRTRDILTAQFDHLPGSRRYHVRRCPGSANFAGLLSCPWLDDLRIMGFGLRFGPSPDTLSKRWRSQGAHNGND